MTDLNGYTRLSREEKERRLNQKGKALWMTGLSGAGKTTIALGLEKELFNRGFFVKLMDGDDVRTKLNKDLSFTPESRTENIRRIAEVNALFVTSGIITINCFISPTHEIRAMARDIIGPDNFLEIFVSASLEACEKRDVKGLYAKARAGMIPDFTGISAPYDVPAHPDLVIETTSMTIEDSVNMVLDFVIPRITYKR